MRAAALLRRRQPHLLHVRERRPALTGCSGKGADWPSSATLFSLGVVVVMGYALSADLLRAKRLVVELGERENEADLAADAANLGIWTRDIVRGPHLGEQEMARAVRLRARRADSTSSRWSQRIHADDRPAFSDRLTQAAGSGATTRASSASSCPTARCAGSPPSAGSTSTPRAGRCAAAAPASTSPRARRRAGDARPAPGHRPRRPGLGDGPDLLGAGARDQPAARGDPAQRRGGGAVPAAPVARPARDQRDPRGHPQGRPARQRGDRPDAHACSGARRWR